MLGVGVGLHDVFALHIQPAEGPVERGLEHIGDAHARLVIEGDAPVALEQAAGGGVGEVTIARQFVRE